LVDLTGSGSKLLISFADPSCRDFLLAYLESNPDEVRRLFLNTKCLFQAVLLLQYADSFIRRNGRRAAAHPGFKRALSLSPQVIAQLDQLSNESFNEPQNHLGPYRFFSAALSVLGLLGVPGKHWLESRITDLAEDQGAGDLYPACQDVFSLAKFAAELLAECSWEDTPPVDRLESAVAFFGSVLANVVDSEEAFALYVRLRDKVHMSGVLNTACASDFEDSVLDFVRQELGLLENWEDAEGMQYRFDELVEIATEHEVRTALELDFAEARTKSRLSKTRSHEGICRL
jgi:hypothetical protein